jgi:DNA mismatch repair ATPase MutS
MGTGVDLVPNDINFNDATDVLLVTGPNMGGKSTLLRQTCLAIILAQIGSFVPAKEMKLSVRDKIFSRIGASDSLLEGKFSYKEIRRRKAIFLQKETFFNFISLIDSR